MTALCTAAYLRKMSAAQFSVLLASVSAVPPHIVHVIVDDLGWGNVGWHRAAAGLPPTPEVRTPNLDALAHGGINLLRFYSFKSCSPSRSSFQSGRIPVHVLDANTVPESFNPNDTISGYAGVPVNMTCVANWLKRAPIPYDTHFFGKWDVGMATQRHTPRGRGYDTSIAYFHHSNDYYTEYGDGTTCRGAIDIWSDDAPASSFNTSFQRKNNQRNGSVELYEDYKFLQSAKAIIKAKGEEIMNAAAVSEGGGGEAENAAPLFLTFAPHLVHEPLQVPTVYLESLEAIITDNDNRLMYHAMVLMLDDVIGNLTQSLKDANLWETCLFVLVSDNGGPSYNSAHTANNYPLRGSKLSDWEGGVRLTGFVNGGWVAASQRGTSRTGLIAMADWLATYAQLAGLTMPLVDEEAKAAKLPPIDSMSMVAYLRGDVATSPRKEYQVDSNVLLKELTITRRVAGVMGGAAATTTSTTALWKLFGDDFPSTPQGATGWACFPGPHYPNATDPGCKSGGNCDKKLGGCLFELNSDPTEHVDVATTESEAMKTMRARLAELQATLFTPDRGSKDPRACEQVAKNGGFYGPWL